MRKDLGGTNASTITRYLTPQMKPQNIGKFARLNTVPLFNYYICPNVIPPIVAPYYWTLNI